MKLCPGRGLNENAIEEINKGVVSDEKQASFHKNHLFREKNQYNQFPEALETDSV